MSVTQIVNLALDGVFILLIAIVIIRNCVKGFLSSIISLIKTVVAPVAAVVFNLPIARLIAKPFNGACSQWIYKLLLTTETKEFVEGVEAKLYDVDTIFEGIPNMITRFILRAGENYPTKEFIDKFFDTTDGNVPAFATTEELTQISDVIGSRVALGVSILVTFVAIFVIVELFLLIFGALLNKLIKKVKMIKAINILMGGLIGLAIGVIITWAGCFGVGKVFEFGQHYYPNIFLDEYWNGTIVVKFFIEHDILEIINTIAIR